MKNISNTEAELKNSVACKKACILLARLQTYGFSKIV